MRKNINGKRNHTVNERYLKFFLCLIVFQKNQITGMYINSVMYPHSIKVIIIMGPPCLSNTWVFCLKFINFEFFVSGKINTRIYPTMVKMLNTQRKLIQENHKIFVCKLICLSLTELKTRLVVKCEHPLA